MKNMMFRSIRSKVVISVLGASLLGGGAFVFLAYTTGSRMLEEQILARAGAVGTVLQGVVESEMAAGDPLHLRAPLRNTAYPPDILNVLLLGPDGSVRFAARPDSSMPAWFPVPGGNGKEGEQAAMQGPGDRVRYVLHPIRGGDACLGCHPDGKTSRGYFAIGVSTESVGAPARDHRATNILMVGLLLTGGAGVLVGMLSFTVLRPVRRLHAYIRQAGERMEQGEGVAPVRIPELERKDEIGDLYAAFQQLLGQLQEAQARLRELHSRRMEEADRLASMGTLAAGIAHEIRNPVAGVQGALQILESETEPGSPRREIIGEMMDLLDRVNGAVSDLLSHARPETPAMDPVQVNDVLRRIAALMQGQIRDGAVSIRTALAEDLPPVTGDAKQLRQLFWNVMMNGLQALEGKGELAVETRPQEGWVEVVVSDTGRGMSREVLASVFTPFFTTKPGGTGLGLAVSRRIAEQHGGGVSIESTEGRGTTVTIRIPPEGMGRP
ncbi:MAG: ATP-binding protein [Bacteroidota bacterium]